MKQYLKNWNLMRVIRFIIGILIIIQGVQSKDWLFLFAGLFFAALPLFNIGCCNSKICNTTTRRVYKHSSDNIEKQN